MRQDTLNTLNILKSISDHLASRPICKDLEYVVVMSNTPKGPKIKMEPYISVFPDIHRRKTSDRASVVTHVLKYHFNDVKIIVPGTYIFRMSVDGKRRKWARIESL